MITQTHPTGPAAAHSPGSSNRQRRALRRLAHHLSPVVSIGEQGVSDGVTAETDRALRDHELIKVRVHSGERADRVALGDALAAACSAEVIARVGKTLVLFRANPDADPRLSNLSRGRG